MARHREERSDVARHREERSDVARHREERSDVAITTGAAMSLKSCA